MAHDLTLSRRDWLRASAAGLLTTASVPWFESLATAAVERPRRKSCILLWMDGGPSQQHTFDPKPTGEFPSISTSVPGIEITDRFPRLSQCMEHMAIVRSMSTEINDHYDAKYLLHTGYRRVTAFEHPAIGCIASHQNGRPNDEMPAFVTIDAGFDKGNGGRLYRSVPAYLGPQHAPLAVHNPADGLENLEHPRTDLDRRLALLSKGESRFAEEYAAPAADARRSAFERAVKLMRSKRSTAFDIERESPGTREAYGDHAFGKSCLLARRLVESGVSFVEIFHRGWDDHEGAAKRINVRAPWMDKGMSTLILDLENRGLLDDTLVVWMGEFGRSPGNGNGHFCRAWSTVWAGGGVQGGRVVGKTSVDGKNPGDKVVERPVNGADFVSTLCLALGIDMHQEFVGPGLRPMPIVDKSAEPVTELFS